MNNYDYYRTHKQEIDNAIANQSAENTVGGIAGFILLAQIVIAMFIGAYFVVFPPLSRKVLQKYYNRAYFYNVCYGRHYRISGRKQVYFWKPIMLS